MNATFEVNPLIESLPVTSASIGATNHGINPFLSPFFFVGLQRQEGSREGWGVCSNCSVHQIDVQMIRIVAGTGGRCSLRRTIRPMNRSARPLTRTHAHKKKSFRLFRRRIKRASAEMIRWQSFLNNSFIYKLRECQQWNFLRKYSTINNWLK